MITPMKNNYASFALVFKRSPLGFPMILLFAKVVKHNVDPFFKIKFMYNIISLPL